MQEAWAPIVGYESSYAVSDQGRVKSLPRTIVYRDGRKRHYPESPVSTPVSGNGYQTVHLWAGNARTTRTVHTLVADAFHGPSPFTSAQALHRNGDPLDNRASNIRWGTPLENSDDARRHGTIARGSRSHGAKLTDERVAEVRTLWATGKWLQAGLAEVFDVDQAQISRAVNGKAWTHVA